MTTNDFLFISNGQALTFQALKKSESEYFSDLKQQSFNFTYKNFDIIDQDNAIANLVGILTAMPKDGPIQKYNIAETIIFKRLNGVWKIIGGHESYVLRTERKASAQSRLGGSRGTDNIASTSTNHQR